MAATGANQEIEVKLRMTDPGLARERILAAGYREYRPRHFEANELWDTPEDRLRLRGEIVRLRTVERQVDAVLTWKGPSAGGGAHKSREEREIRVSDGTTAALILGRLGLAPAFRYEKFRTEFISDDERGVVTLDETPIGCFMELEGAPAWIDAAAQSLGFTPADYVLDSYGRLYLAHCERHHLTPGHMVFDAEGTPESRS